MKQTNKNAEQIAVADHHGVGLLSFQTTKPSTTSSTFAPSVRSAMLGRSTKNAMTIEKYISDTFDALTASGYQPPEVCFDFHLGLNDKGKIEIISGSTSDSAESASAKLPMKPSNSSVKIAFCMPFPKSKQ